MSSRRSVRQVLIAVLLGVLVGGGLMAVTPAGAQVSSAAATSWKKIWKKNLKPLADRRYYKKSQSDAKYQPKGAYETAGSGYSKTETYSKAEADAKYSAAGSAYSKAEIDAKLAPFVNSVAAIAGGDQVLALASADQVVRTVSLLPPANGKVIVSASAGIEPSASGIFRCSITTSAAIDFDALQVVNGVAGDYLTTGATRGFNVTKGSLFTVNYVCDQFSGQANLRDGNLTAIFAPN